MLCIAVVSPDQCAFLHLFNPMDMCPLLLGNGHRSQVHTTFLPSDKKKKNTANKGMQLNLSKRNRFLSIDFSSENKSINSPLLPTLRPALPNAWQNVV